MQKTKKNKTRSLYFSERITEVMKDIYDHPLTIVEAPMGYGKTTAVSESLNKADADVLWQRVYDSSTTGFWKGFCRLFNQLDNARAESLLQLEFPYDNVMLQEALNLIEDMEIPEDTVLVIDDYHLVDSMDVNYFFESLVKNKIINLHIVLSARYTKFQNLDEMKLKGYLHHITKETLEFTPDEIAKYYKKCGISIKDTEAKNLYSYTEGWISALYLFMLNFLEEGNFSNTADINNLIERAIFASFSEDIKEFLITLCAFDFFTFKQASYMWEKENTDVILKEITNKNAFVKYDSRTRTYQIHSLFINFLKDKFDSKGKNYRQGVNQRAAKWYMEDGEYLSSMRYAYLAGDFDNLLKAIEMDKGHSINSEYKEQIIKYLEECPEETKQRVPFAMLVFARRMFTYNEVSLFKKTCGEFMTNIQMMDRADEMLKNRLLGEYELLQSFSVYNDMQKMSEYIQRACGLLKEPSTLLDGKGSWTFGSPSVLYMFHRKTGELEKEVQIIRDFNAGYNQITNDHGKGGELVMAAEHYYYMGNFESAEIETHKAYQASRFSGQTGINICCVFLQIRLAFIKGDFPTILDLFKTMRENINTKKWYIFVHTLDMCETYIYSCLKIKGHIAMWIKNGEFKNTKLFFPSMAFLNIVYGRTLLIEGEYLKLIGISEQFLGIASVFSNLLGHIHTYIYLAAANQQIYRSKEALVALQQALDIAMPDKVYMPFVENCDYIKPLLEALYDQGDYREDIPKILELYAAYEKAVEKIIKEHFAESTPKLTVREMEIAQLAAEGLSNMEIGEQLFTSPNTVKKHLKNIFNKLGVNSRALIKQSLVEKAK